MFWRFGGYTNTSSIDSTLDKPDVTLEELLDDGDLIQELKQQNSKLIEYLREEPVLQKLLRYVIADRPLEPTATTQTPGEDVTSPGSGLNFFGKGKGRSRSKSAHKAAEDEAEEEKQQAQLKKYSYMACEVLSSEVWSLTEAVLEYKDHLHEFWDYLRRPAPLDALQAGYFTKVNETLLDKKTEDMLVFLKSLDGIVPEMLKHVDCPMIMDLLLKMISLEKQEGGQGIVDWLQSQQLIPILLSYLSPDNPLATQTSAGDFLKAIITISANATAQDQTVIGPNELTRQLVSEKCVSQLIDNMLKGGNPLTVGVGIVIEVIRKNNSDYDLDNQVGPEPRTTDPIYLGVMLRQFANHIPDFMTLVRSPKATKPGLKTAFGEKVQPLGFDRFKTCELMAELLHCSNMGLLNERGSEAEMRARDADREKLKDEGKLTPAPIQSESDEHFASSVDSHGFHHARAPSDDEKNRLEVQNASDEDGFESFEKVGVADADDLPDEVTFDEINEKIEDTTAAPAPLGAKSTAVPSSEPAPSDEMQKLELSGQEETQSGDKPRVSSLTRQIDEELSRSERSGSEDLDERMNMDTSTNPEDKPAPLFASKSSAEKGADPILGTASPEDDQDQDQSILSTATLQPEHQETAEIGEEQPYGVDLDGTPVVGDLLKIQFVEHQVVPTILDFFFRFPWNNFLHNVVYDVVQQVFNGTLSRGYNRVLAQDLFMMSGCPALASKQDVTQRVLDGQAESDKSQKEKGMRLGYMGHLTLIAEEVCKFVEKYPQDVLGEHIIERISRPEWTSYIEGTLSETRDKDNAVLGGVRPENAIGMRNSIGQNNYGGNGNSNVLSDAGIGGSGVPADSLAMADAGPGEGFETNASTSGLLSGFGEGEDEDEEKGLEGERHTSPFADEEQTAASLSPTGATIPPPLKLPPSRARRQLAARLAERKRRAEATDPDAADPAALQTAAERPIEPLGNDTTEGSIDRAARAELRDSLRSPVRGDKSAKDPARFERLFTYSRSEDSDDDDGSESSSLDSDSDSDTDSASNHMGPTRPSYDDGDGAAEDPASSGLTRKSSRSGSKNRPFTTTAKTRMSIDDEDPDFGAGRDVSLDADDEHDDDRGITTFTSPVTTFTSPESYASPGGTRRDASNTNTSGVGEDDSSWRARLGAGPGVMDADPFAESYEIDSDEDDEGEEFDIAEFEGYGLRYRGVGGDVAGGSSDEDDDDDDEGEVVEIARSRRVSGS